MLCSPVDVGTEVEGGVGEEVDDHTVLRGGKSSLSECGEVILLILESNKCCDTGSSVFTVWVIFCSWGLVQEKAFQYR
jgi:hypothetical protein